MEAAAGDGKPMTAMAEPGHAAPAHSSGSAEIAEQLRVLSPSDRVATLKGRLQFFAPPAGAKTKAEMYAPLYLSTAHSEVVCCRLCTQLVILTAGSLEFPVPLVAHTSLHVVGSGPNCRYLGQDFQGA